MKNLARIDSEISGSGYLYRITGRDGYIRLNLDIQHSVDLFENPNLCRFTDAGVSMRDKVASSDLFSKPLLKRSFFQKWLGSEESAREYGKKVLPYIAAFITSATHSPVDLIRDEQNQYFLIFSWNGEEYKISPNCSSSDSFGSDILEIFPLSRQCDELAHLLINYSLSVSDVFDKNLCHQSLRQSP